MVKGRKFKNSSLKFTLPLLFALILFVISRGLFKISADTPLPQGSRSFIELSQSTKPNFKPGHTLPRLTYWLGGGMSFDTAQELTKNWGYAMTVVTAENYQADINNSNSPLFKAAELAKSDPETYPLALIPAHYWMTWGDWNRIDDLPESAWLHIDSPGTARTRMRTQLSTTSSAGLSVGTIRQYAVDGHTAAFYKCLNPENAHLNPPTVHNVANDYWGIPTDAELDASPGQKIWSPEAPTSIGQSSGQVWADPIISLKNKYPTIKTPIVINGTEYGLQVPAVSVKNWKQDPAVYAAMIAAGVPIDSNDYIVQFADYRTKQQSRLFDPIIQSLKSAVPDRDLYIHYGASAAQSRRNWWAGDTNNVLWWGGGEMTQKSEILDIYSSESYFGEGYHNSWVDATNSTIDLFQMATNAMSQQIKVGIANTYDFISAGWRTSKNTLAVAITDTSNTLIGNSAWQNGMPSTGWLQIDDEIIKYGNMITGDSSVEGRTITILERGVNPSNVVGYDMAGMGVTTSTTPVSHSVGKQIYKLPQYGASARDTYMGFLKMKYALGTIGTCAFYAIPSENDPFWLWQFQSAGHVHALYSYLEDYLRDGDLLPGEGVHTWSVDYPSYEFNTGEPWTQVVVRKKKTSNDWLIAAWVQNKETGGVDHDVNVTIPELGTVTVNARVAGSVYTAKLDDQGKPVLTLVDADSMNPTDGINLRVVGGVTPPAPEINLGRDFTYQQKINISGQKASEITSVIVNNNEAAIDNIGNVWSCNQDLNFGSNLITVAGRDQNGNISSTVTKNIIRRKPADANGDNHIDIKDFSSLMLNWGKAEAQNVADFNEDGKVNIYDFSILMLNWGK